MLVYLEDQNLTDHTQMMVYSKDTASFYIDSNGKTQNSVLVLAPSLCDVDTLTVSARMSFYYQSVMFI